MAKKKAESSHNIVSLHKQLKKSIKETELAIQRSIRRSEIQEAKLAEEMAEYRNRYGNV